MSTPDPIPADQSPLTPHLVVGNARAALEFYAQAFGAEESFRLTEPSGKIGHAELRIGGALVMLSDEYPDFGAQGPASIGGSPVKLHLYVAEVDAVVAQAVAAGATLLRPVRDEFYGDRTGTIADPFGHCWQVASRIARVTPAEMQARWDAMMTSAG